MKDIDYIDNRKRIMQANLNNQGGAFSVAYEVQQQLQKEYIFDYFSSDKFVENDIYKHLLSMGSRCVGGVECKSRFLKQYEVYKAFKEYLKNNRYISFSSGAQGRCRYSLENINLLFGG